jgi:hypothetical protein
MVFVSLTMVVAILTTVFVVFTMVFVILSPVFVTFPMVFAFPTMVIVFSTLVFDVEKMVLSLNHIFSPVTSFGKVESSPCIHHILPDIHPQPGRPEVADLNERRPVARAQKRKPASAHLNPVSPSRKKPSAFHQQWLCRPVMKRIGE